jgi:serine phosphatase RsbU (regulator of sigma subunit)
MFKETINSEAFRRASLKSEMHRVIGLLGILLLLLVFVVVRGLATSQFLLLSTQFAVLGLFIVHEAFMFLTIKRALRDDINVEPAVWVLNVIIESQIPTIGLFLLLASNWQTPYQVMFAPVVLVYFLLIILSTLRLSPSMSLLTGLLSALGYLFAFFYVELRFQGSAATLLSLPKAVYLGYAGLIFAGGAIAAIVARQIRSHVTAALREAQLQSELDRMSHDLDIARSIQQDLLPTRAPQLDQFDIAGWNQPADQTGGDYFDWQELPDGRFAISLGDATGHGIGPALVSASCRAYARASFLGNGHHDGLLDRLNALLHEDLSANRFVTFVVGFLNPSNSHVEILSAGHGPILWYKYLTSTIQNLEAQGIPLGMIAGTKYGRATNISLDPGDMIVLVTDGFYEWENPEGEQFGLQRLETLICDCSDDPSAEIIAKLRTAVLTFCRGTKQQDDLTAVILKRK